ncbi:MAG: acetylxylan esterase [Fuerstiella sp.]
MRQFSVVGRLVLWLCVYGPNAFLISPASAQNGDAADGSDGVSATEQGIWDMQVLSQVPAMTWLDAESPIRSLTYEGESWQGRTTSVFAFYATPGTISGDKSADRDLPAVVLVHGGGGTAFAEWVLLWAQRGYAAIAMDLSGRRPAAPVFRQGQLVSSLKSERTRLTDGGPEQGHAEKFDSVGGDQSDDWPFHAVANVIRAHSLVRSFDEVDADRTAVTGISWGGYTTCIVASVDSRFKAAVPVYGCGFLYDGESVQRPLIDALPAARRAEWIRRYDPSSHLSRCQVPILFVNGTNDRHYPLRSYSRSYSLVPGPKQIRLEVNMRHSHQAGWEPQEIGLFIDSHLQKGTPLPVLKPPVVEQGRAQVAFESALPLKSTSLHFTTDDGPLLQRRWKTLPAEIEGQSIRTGRLPADVTLWMVSATDSRGAMTSTDVVFAAEGGE